GWTTSSGRRGIRSGSACTPSTEPRWRARPSRARRSSPASAGRAACPPTCSTQQYPGGWARRYRCEQDAADSCRGGRAGPGRGANFTACNGQPTGAPVDDDVGHGSMTTGIMVADTNNGQGIAAVAPDASALAVKVLHRTVTVTGQVTGSGCDNDVAAGIRYAA